MRRRWIYDNKGNMVEVTNGRAVSDQTAPMVIPDIEPYQSMIDGRLITSRSAHREHLKVHGCVELGNDAPIPDPNRVYSIPEASPGERKELIRAQFDAMTHSEFKKALNRDIDRIKWNSHEN